MTTLPLKLACIECGARKMTLPRILPGVWLALLVFFAATLRAQEPQPPAEPEIVSIFPLVGQQSTTRDVVARGKNLNGVYAVWFDDGGLEARVPTPDELKSKPGQPSATELTFQLEIGPSTRLGTHFFRLVSTGGVSAAVPFDVTDQLVIMETDKPHGTANEAQLVLVPAVVNGKIAKSGEVDYYAFDVVRRQELVFEVCASPVEPNLGALVLQSSEKFEPHITLRSFPGSWLHPDVPVRLASKDAVASASKPVQLSYEFRTAGRFYLEVGSYLGIGGPDFSYQLRVIPPELAAPARPRLKAIRPKQSNDWRERDFLRRIEADWLELLAVRNGQTPAASQNGNSELGPDPAAASIPSDNPMTGQDPAPGTATAGLPLSVADVEPNDSADQVQEITTVPSLIEGTIGEPGDIDTYKLKVTPGQRLAFEIETPNARYPEFNPKLTVLDGRQNELLTNIQKRITGQAENATSYFKSVDAKVIETFEQGGDCFLQIRDVTSRYGDATFLYRVLVREQIPHIGEFEVKNGDHINLTPGDARKVTVVADLEEGYSGECAILVDGLPEGVRTYAGVEPPTDANAIAQNQKTYKEQSFHPTTSQVTVVFCAEADAPATAMPQMVRLTAQPIVQGRLGPVLPVWELPVMVVHDVAKK